MAGTQNIGESSENPVAINVTAMVDVIFCLCIFFMCSFKFKQLEGKIESWLPRGAAASASQPQTLEEIRVVLTWENDATVRRVGNRNPAASDRELVEAVLSMAADHRNLGRNDFPVLIQAAREVPWAEVVHIMDLCQKEGLERIEFTAGS